MYRLAARYHRTTGHKVELIFDGTRKDLVGGSRPGVHATFAGPGKTADEVLKQRSETLDGIRETIFVSDDREVLKNARRRGAKPVKCDQFLRMVRSELRKAEQKTPEPEFRLTSPTAEEVQEWLRFFHKDTRRRT